MASDYCKGPRGGGRHLRYHLLSISQPSCYPQLVLWPLSPADTHGWGPGLLPERSQSRRPLLPQPGRKGGLGSLGRLHQLLGFKEALEVSHLPDADGYENEGLQDRPPEHPLVGALAGLPEALLSPLWEGRKEDEPELAGPHLGPLELLGSLPGGCPRAN